jgi:hypothetical protein
MFRFSMKRTVMTAAALLALTACGGQATAIQPTPYRLCAPMSAWLPKPALCQHAARRWR